MSEPQRDLVVVGPATQLTGVTTNSAEQRNKWFRGAIFIVNATASAGDNTEDLTVKIQIQHPGSDTWVDYLTIGTYANGATGIQTALVYPGAVDTNTFYGLLQATSLPYSWRINAVVAQGGGSGSYTFSVSASYLI